MVLKSFKEGKKCEVSIVIISWKMKDLLETNLLSIYNYIKDISFELILVDNASNDGTVEMVSSKFPDIKLIRNIKNIGVAPARNQGLKIAKGNYILVLDADMELCENSVQQLYDYMESNPTVGLVGCKLVDSENNLQFSCKRFPSFLTLLFRRLDRYKCVRNSKILRYHTMQDWDHKEIKKVDYLIGACQFIRKSVIEKIGMYDDKIFYGPEDIDFCLRIWKEGWKVIYFPYTNMVHHEQRITKKKFFSKISLKHFYGILYLYKKYNFKISI